MRDLVHYFCVYGVATILNDRINSPLPLGTSNFYVNAILNFIIIFTLCSGVAHQCIEPAIYNGYDIPKGSMLVPNIWYENYIYDGGPR